MHTTAAAAAATATTTTTTTPPPPPPPPPPPLGFSKSVSVLNYLICCIYKEVHLSDQCHTFCLIATSSGSMCMNNACFIELVLLSTVLHFVMPSK
jgi:hypothetical protein